MGQDYRVYSFLAPALLPVYQYVTARLARALGVAMTLVEGGSYDELEHADFAFICGLPYVLRTPPRQTPGALLALAAPVVEGARYENRPIYFSDVIVQRESRFQRFADLRGATWAYNEPESQSGYGVTRCHLLKMGAGKGFFGQVVQAGFHHEALRRVAAGEIDGAAVDSHLLAVLLRDRPDLASQIRVIDALGPSTIQPFAAARRIAPALMSEVRDALTHLHDDPEAKARLGAGLIERFAAVDDADYDDIRAMLAACEAAGFVRLE